MAEQRVEAVLSARDSGFSSSLARATETLNQFEGALQKANTQADLLGKGVSGADANVQKTGITLKGFSTSLGNIGTNLTKFVTLPLAGAGVASTKMATDFESAMVGVRKTTDLTEAEFADMGRAIRDLALSVPATTEEIARVAEAAGQLGIEKDSIMDFTKVMINLGESTNVTAEEASSLLAQFANITGMPQTQFEELGSTIVALGNSFATTEADIISMSHRMAAAGSSVNMTEAEILSFSTALSSIGISAQAGGGAFSRWINDVNSQVQTSGDKLEIYGSIAGMTGAEFQKAFKEDAAGALAVLVQGLGDTERNGKSTVEMLQLMGIEETQLTSALQGLAGSGDLLNRTLDVGSEAWEQNTALAKEANLRYADSTSQLEMAKNAVKDAAIELGQQLLPSVVQITQGLAEMVRKFTDLDSGTQKFIIGLAGVGMALGPIAKTTSSVINAGSQLSGVFKKISAGAGGAAGASGKLAGAVSGLGVTGPVGLAIAGAAALAVGLVALVRDMTTATKATRELIDTTEKSAGTFNDATKDREKNNEVTNRMVSRLKELESQTNKTVGEQEEMKSIVDSLNESIPEMNLAIDEETGALNMSGEAIDSYVESHKAKLELEAIDERRIELIKEQTELEMQLADAEARSAETGIQNARKRQKANNDIKELNEALAASNTEMELLDAKYEESATIQQEAIESTKTATVDLGETAVETYDQIGAEAAEAAQEAAEAQAQALKEAEEAYKKWGEDVTKETESVYGKMGPLGTGAVEATKLTAEEVKANLEAQIEDWQAWQTGLAQIQGKVPTVMYEELSKMGPAAQPLLDEYNNMTSLELAEHAQLYKDKHALAVEFALEEVGEMPAEAKAIMGETAVAIEGKSVDIKTAGKKLGKAGVDGFAETRSQYTDAGSSNAKSALDGAETKLSESYGTGAELGSELASGIEDQSSQTSTSGDSLANAAVGAARSESIIKAWYSAGTNSSSIYATGVEANSTRVDGAGRNLAQQAKDGASAIEFSSVGTNAGSSFARSLRAYGGKGYSAGYSVGYQALKGFKASLGIRSPSRPAREYAENVGNTFINNLLGLATKAEKAGATFADSAMPKFDTSGIDNELRALDSNIRTKTGMSLRNSVSVSQQPMSLTLNMGNQTFNAFTRNINKQGDNELELESVYGV